MEVCDVYVGESSDGAGPEISTTTTTTASTKQLIVSEGPAQPTTPSKPIPARPIRMLSEISLDNLLFPSYTNTSTGGSGGGGGSYNGCLRSRTRSPAPKPKTIPSNLLMLQNDELDKVVKRKKGGTFRPRVVRECEPLAPKLVTPSTPDPSEKKLGGRKRKRIEEDINLFTLGKCIPYDREVQNETATSPLAIQCSYGVAKAEGTLIPEIFMGNDDSECTEQKAKEKREEEKQILLGQVESFMSSMKLIQGDRQFSRWKGSVVDSVAGAFLTQNVNDKLSSSAFMSLAAKYPIANLATGKGTRSNKAKNESSSSCMGNKTKNATVIRKRQKRKVNGKEYKDVERKIKLKRKVYKVNQVHKVDWKGLRKSLIKADEASGSEGQRDENSEDALDWYAVHGAEVGDISAAIELRGMNNKLATRIKSCLNFLKKEQGSFSLEWLRGVSPQIAKEFLLSIRGLGLKSVECIRLLTLQHAAFPVDRNVARIATRLGWVRLQPLPEGVQLHLLQEYPPVNSVQKFLWERLCILGKEKLNELHFQMITFGKVICTKTNPNCNACPVRVECKHFSSKFARYELPDSHSLLEGLDEREKDDKCPYLLFTRSRGDAKNSSEVPEGEIDSVQEGECQTLLGTFLIPCRTATQGIFPLDGTYFQNNEVFADHETSLCPIKVSRKLIKGLPEKNLYCGTSVTAIYRGLSIVEIVDRFWRGYICLRGFRRQTREPKDLARILHITKHSKRMEGELKKRTVGQK